VISPKNWRHANQTADSKIVDYTQSLQKLINSLCKKPKLKVIIPVPTSLKGKVAKSVVKTVQVSHSVPREARF